MIPNYSQVPDIMKETIQKFPKLHRYFTIMAKVSEKAIHLTELLKVLELGNEVINQNNKLFRPRGEVSIEFS